MIKILQRIKCLFDKHTWERSSIEYDFEFKCKCCGIKMKDRINVLLRNMPRK
jgi:hypothetical protein